MEVVDVVAGRPGPRLALIAGIHGDEPEGPLAVMRLLDRLPELMVRGSVRAVAIAHPAAFQADRRESPLDGCNLARVFPGSVSGTPTERLAMALHEHVIAPSAFVIDLHSAGRDFAMPLDCGFRGAADTEAASAAAAHVFGAPLTWRHTGAPARGRTVSSAVALGIPCLYAEAEGGHEVRGRSLELFVDGVLRVAHHLGQTSAAPDTTGERLILDGGQGDIDRAIASPEEGYLVTMSAAGELVEAGQPLGVLLDAAGGERATIEAPRRGMLMLLRRRARVRRGETVAMVAGEPRRWQAVTQP